MANKRIQGITIEIDGNTKKLNDALKDTYSVISRTNSELKDLNKALKLDPTNTELLSQKQEVLKRNIEATKEKLDSLKEAQRQMGNYNDLTDEQKENYRALSVEISKTESTLKSLKKEYQDFGSVAKQQLENASKSMKDFGKNISSAGRKMSVASAAVSALGVAAMSSAGKLEQSIGGAKSVFGDFSDVIIENAKKSAEVMGTSENEYLEYANKIGSLMKGSGLETKQAVDLSTQAMQRAADVASIMGIDVSSAMEAITGAAKGNFTMMDNLGVAMNATTLNAYALEKGLGKTYAQMTNGEKVQLAYQMFLEKTAEYAGNYAKENDTLNGSLTTIQAKFENVSADLGEKLLPIAIKALEFVSKLIDKFNNLSPETQKMILIIGGIVAAAGPLMVILGSIITLLGVLISPIGLIVVAITAVIAIVVLLYNKCEWFRKGVKAVVEGIVAYFKSIPDRILYIPTLIYNTFSALISKFKTIGKDLMSGIVNGLKERWNNLKKEVENLGGSIVKKFKSIFGIKSPSRVMRDEVGKNLALGIGVGIEKEIPSVIRDVNAAMSDLNNGIQSSLNPTINPTANTNPLIIQIENFNNTRQQDVQALAEELEFYRKNSAIARGGN